MNPRITKPTMIMKITENPVIGKIMTGEDETGVAGGAVVGEVMAPGNPSIQVGLDGRELMVPQVHRDDGNRCLILYFAAMIHFILPQ